MLLSTQKKLYDAEVTLAAQSQELDTLRTQTQDQQTELHQTRNAKIAQDTAIAEMRHITQLLAQAESSAATNTTDKGALDAAHKDISDLRGQLTRAQTAAQDVDALRKRVSEQDQRLQITTRELAEVTTLLKQSESSKQDTSTQQDALRDETRRLTDRITQLEQQHKAAQLEVSDLTNLLEANETHWQTNGGMLEVNVNAGRAAVAALIAPPDTMRLDQDRLNLAAAALVASGTFDPDWYLKENTDVADSGADPTLHFLEFGFAEGRAPRAQG